MKYLNYIKNSGSTICLIISLLFFLFSLLVNTFSVDQEDVAEQVGRKVEKRMMELDKYVDQAVSFDHDRWLQMDLPEDMVIYRYVYDTLQSWCNQFPIINDDIGARVVFQNLSNLRTSLTSPLSTVTEEVRYMNLGSKWYLVKSVSGGMACRVIAGLEVQDMFSERTSATGGGTNKHLSVPRKFSIVTLDESGGTSVNFKGEPVFKIAQETISVARLQPNSILRWIALLFVAGALLIFLRQHRRLRNYFVIMILLLGAAAMAYIWGIDARETLKFFSPTIYAGGHFLYSFGALIILNITVILLVGCTYMMRVVIYRRIWGKRWKTAVYGVTVILATVAVAVYVILTLHSLIMNSNVPWELHLWSQISVYTVVTYVIYTMILFCILLLIQMLSPVLYIFAGWRYNVFTRKGVLIFAIACAGYFAGTSSVLGFMKEQNRVVVMSNRLAVDRDLSLEMGLRSVEEAISTDPVISALSHVDQSDYILLNRLTETYLSRISRNYDITVVVCANNDAGCFSQYEQRFMSGSPIADRSRFIYTYDSNGRSGYLGMFVYYSSEKGLSRIMIDIGDRSNREDGGYYSLLGRRSTLGNVDIPVSYSYAKYLNGRLTRYRGDFAYPTIMEEGVIEKKLEKGRSYYRDEDYVHFFNRIYEDEYVIVSRKKHSSIAYLVTFSYLLIINLLLLWPLLRRNKREKEQVFRKNYYRSRINAVLFASLFLTLVVMATLSVTFVYRRNTSNMYSMMSEKITSIQTILEGQCRRVTDLNDVNVRDMATVLESIGSDMKSDITVFTPGGKVFCSTTPEVFDRMELGSRINEYAYYNVKYEHQRFYINAERNGDDRFYSMYAPLLNDAGNMIGIICVPYAEQNIDFRNEALFHAATFINVFLILIVLTLLVSTAVVNNMFRPLVEMGRKMNSADLHGMEYIIYKREDEVSSLVEAYNRMVHDLYESMKQVTQAERDKAWSEMARQVAHEIKNPLTPIKLELQRLIRLKEKNDPAWDEKFDKVSAIVLEHIDILTDTANEFSTFAKLYTEEPVEMDLDKTLRDQVMIFDNKENIEMSYMGLEGVIVTGPKPQLIRVFVNLITNAIQAVEMRQNDESEAGREVVKGRILISLRNGVQDGYYDIVVEDNGSGVKEGNQSKLFTPNFTTKSSGTGLGLAICRNIVEKCNGKIFYQRSFTLGGACFVVSLPKPRPLVAHEKGYGDEA